ncbi:MAG: ribosome maturation factor [Rhizobiales bacterium]|nr:ribosome maturation factor [Hyphomicrobiales bacterium]
MGTDFGGDARFFRETGLAAEIAELAEPVLSELGFRLVRVLVSSRDGGTIQVMFDHAGREVDASDCERVSRALDPTIDAYVPKARSSHGLEVSSPGIDRPLVRPSDIEAHIGHEARLELREMVEGRKRFRGRLEGMEDGELRLETDLGGEAGVVVLGFPLTMVESAKLVLTDELIALGQARRALAAQAAAEGESGGENEGSARAGETAGGDIEPDAGVTGSANERPVGAGGKRRRTGDRME